MKQLVNHLLIAVLGLVFLVSCQAQKATICGPEGKIAYKITLPEGFDTANDQCPMVILMHGIFSSKDFIPMPQLAKGLAGAGIASIRFDFNGHGKSEGRKQDMTIEKELADARAVWDYVQSLPYVSEVGLLGHSQGGVVTSMTAGRLATESKEPSGVVLIAPGSVIKEACQGGKFFNARFDPKNPPEYIRCWGIYKLGREYLVTLSSSTSMALRQPIKALCFSSTATATTSCRCGAASDTLKPTALMPPSKWWKAKTIPSPAAASRLLPALWSSLRMCWGSEVLSFNRYFRLSRNLSKSDKKVWSWILRYFSYSPNAFASASS